MFILSLLGALKLLSVLRLRKASTGYDGERGIAEWTTERGKRVAVFPAYLLGDGYRAGRWAAWCGDHCRYRILGTRADAVTTADAGLFCPDCRQIEGPEIPGRR